MKGSWNYMLKNARHVHQYNEAGLHRLSLPGNKTLNINLRASEWELRTEEPSEPTPDQ